MTGEYGLVLCKEHRKRFEWLGKNVYEKERRSDMLTFLTFLKMDKTEDTCMWCEQPGKFEPYTGHFEWMFCEKERKVARCNHDWNFATDLPQSFRDRGILPDGRVVRREQCLKCDSVRYHILKEDDLDSANIKKAALERIVSPDGPFCGNCKRFFRSHSYCFDFTTVRPPFSTCFGFMRGYPKGECNIRLVE